MPQRAYPIPAGAPFQRGDEVVIYGRTNAGKPTIEGRGIVIGGGTIAHSYLVRIEGKPLPLYRIVKPGLSQTGPLRYLAMLEALHRVQLQGSFDAA
jgi:hypothetical protein